MNGMTTMAASHPFAQLGVQDQPGAAHYFVLRLGLHRLSYPGIKRSRWLGDLPVITYLYLDMWSSTSYLFRERRNDLSHKQDVRRAKTLHPNLR